MNRHQSVPSSKPGELMVATINNPDGTLNRVEYSAICKECNASIFKTASEEQIFSGTSSPWRHRAKGFDVVTDKNVEGVIQYMSESDLGNEALWTKFRDRVNHGFEKYGVTTERTDLSFEQWLNHAIEELMDASIYLQVLIDLHTDEDKSQFQECQDRILEQLHFLWDLDWRK